MRNQVDNRICNSWLQRLTSKMIVQGKQRAYQSIPVQPPSNVKSKLFVSTS